MPWWLAALLALGVAAGGIAFDDWWHSRKRGNPDGDS